MTGTHSKAPAEALLSTEAQDTNADHSANLTPSKPQDGFIVKSSLETARWLASLGFAVVQVYGLDENGVCSCRSGANCRKPGKHPIQGDDRWTRSAVKLGKWWESHPDAGVGIQLEQSGLVDVAPDNSEWLAEFKDRGLPPTLSWQSAGGPGHEHHLYRLPEGEELMRDCISGEYDRMSKGIAVVPPTKLAKGSYQWLTEPRRVDALPEAPVWVVAEMRQVRARKAVLSTELVVDTSEPPVPLFGEDLDYWQGTKFELNDKGGVDGSLTLTKLANALARGGMNAYGIDLALHDRALVLGYDKYEGRTDEDKRYAQLALTAVELFGGRRPVVRTSKTGHAEDSAGLTLADLVTAGDDLLVRTFRDPKWVIEGLIPEGLSMLVGKPKMGKSWLSLDAVSGIATGRTVLGKDPTRGPTLYIALEDNQRRLQERLSMVLQSDLEPDAAGSAFFSANLSKLPDARLLDVATRWPKLDQGGLELLDEWLTAHPDARLVVIDPWSRIQPRAGRGSAYDEDYTALGPVQELAMKHNVAILVVHHMRKQETEDPLDAINGSMGLAGVLDAALILKRERSRADAHLYLTGRDIREDGDVPLSWDNQTTRWTISGEAQEARMSSERAEVYSAVKDAGRSISGRAIAELIDRKEATVRRLAGELVKDKLLANDGKGYYVPDPSQGSQPLQGSQTSQPSQGRGQLVEFPGLFDR